MRTRVLDLKGAAGQKLSGRLDLPDGPPQAYVLFAHCFTCTKSSLAAVRIARDLTKRGLGVVRFDFTGLGESDGDFADATFSGDVKDLVAVAGAMADQDMAPKLLVGHSLGGAAVLAAAGDLPSVAAVATIGAPFDVEHVVSQFRGGLEEILEKGEAVVDLGGRPFTVRRSFVDDLRSHDQAARIGALKRPLLILHSPSDATVDIRNATAIFMAAHHPKSFVALDGADHLMTRPVDADYVAQVIAAWASRYIGVAADPAPETLDGQVVAETTGAGRFQVQVSAGGARFLADEPLDVGGLRSGPTPYELLSAGLAACTAMTLRLYAEQKSWPLEKVRVVAGHAKVPDRTPPDEFTREIAVTGRLDADQRLRLVEIAERCPVHKTLTQGAKIVTVPAGETPPIPPETPEEHLRDMEIACAEADCPD